jgi:hypothetical protein
MEVCVAHVAEIKNTYINLVGNRQGKTSLASIPEPLCSIFGEQSGNETAFY